MKFTFCLHRAFGIVLLGMGVGNLLEIYPVKSSYVIKEHGGFSFEGNSKIPKSPGIFCCQPLCLGNDGVRVLIDIIELGNDMCLFKRHQINCASADNVIDFFS